MNFKPGDIIYRGPRRPPIRYLGKAARDGAICKEEFRGDGKSGSDTLVFCDLTTGNEVKRVWWQCCDSSMDADDEVLQDWIVLDLCAGDKVEIAPLTTVTQVGYQTDDGVSRYSATSQIRVTGYQVDVMSADGSRRVIQPRRKL